MYNALRKLNTLLLRSTALRLLTAYNRIDMRILRMEVRGMNKRGRDVIDLMRIGR